MTKRVTKKKTTKAPKREYRGRRPSPEEIAKMQEEGYVLPAAVRAARGLSNGFTYSLIDRLQPIAGDDRKPVRRSERGNVWLLQAAVDAYFAARTGETQS